MVPNFSSYNLLKESVTLKEFEKGNARNLSYWDMKKGFLSKGYEFLGNLSLSIKTINCLSYEEILNVIPDELYDKLVKSFYIDNYLSEQPSKKYLDADFYKLENGKDVCDIKRFISIISEPNIEKVQSCFSKKGNLFYVFWNPEKKYFYFVQIGHTYNCDNSGAIGFFEAYLKIKTSGLDVVTKEVDEIYEKYLEEKRIEDDKWEAKKREESEKKAKEEAYQARVDLLKKDVEEHPENYEELKSSDDLPREIYDELTGDDYMDSKYIHYIEDGIRDPYDVSTDIVYVNDDDFTKGYKFPIVVDHAKRGTYWGD